MSYLICVNPNILGNYGCALCSFVLLLADRDHLFMQFLANWPFDGPSVLGLNACFALGSWC